MILLPSNLHIYLSLGGGGVVVKGYMEKIMEDVNSNVILGSISIILEMYFFQSFKRKTAFLTRRKSKVDFALLLSSWVRVKN